MFGYAALAQSPFAALGNAAYADSVTEAISALLDAELSATVNFQGVVSEDITVADVSSTVYGLQADITENAGFEDVSSVIRAMFDTAVEPVSMLDFASYTGWFIINDNQTVTWHAMNNSQSVTWQNIGNAQTPNWVVINNTQG